MAGNRRAPGWTSFRVALETFADLLPENHCLEISARVAPAVGGVSLQGVPPGLPEKAEALLRDSIQPFLGHLDAWAPLKQDVGSEVWETLVLRVNGWSGNSYLSVRNLLGHGEQITTFGPARGGAAYFAAWCRTRRVSCDQDTPWDVARRERVVFADGKQAVLIDPGVVRILGIAAAAGARTMFSCEGHPDCGYLVFQDAIGEFTRAMLALEPVWTTDHAKQGFASYMRPVTSVADRDAVWRATCASLEASLGLSGALPVVPSVASALPAPGMR